MNSAEDQFTAAIALEEAGQVIQARRAWEIFVEANPTRPGAWLRYGGVLHKLGAFPEAIEAFGRALKRPMNRRYRALAHLWIGRCERDLSALPAAERSFRASLAIKESPEAWEFLADVLGALDRHDETPPCHRAALKLDPNYEEALYNLGCWYGLRKQWGLAEGFFRSALVQDPDYALAHAELGFCLLQKPRALKSALVHLVRAVQLNPDYGWSRLYLAMAYNLSNQRARARRHYQAALRIWPEDPLTHALYGDFVSAGRRDDALALRHLDQAARLGPNDAQVQFYLAKHYARAGEDSKAEVARERAAELRKEVASRDIAT